MSKNYTQEVNKRFVPELRRVVSVSGLLCNMNILQIPILVICYIYIISSSMDFPDSLSLTIRPYHPLLPTDLLDYISCLYRAVVGKFSVGQHWHVYVKGSIKECHMSLSLLLQQCLTCLVRLIWMVLKIGGRWQYNCYFESGAGMGLHVNADKTEYMYFNQKGTISNLNGGSLKLMDKFPYLSSSFSSTESDLSMHLVKAWTAINRLS